MVMTSVVALTLTALLLFMYPKILQSLGLKPAPQAIAEDFETAESDADIDGEYDDDVDGDEEYDGESDEESDEETDEEDDDTDEEDDQNVSIGTDSNIDVMADGSKEGFSMLKQAPPPANMSAPADSSTKRLVVVHASWCGHCKTLLSSSSAWRKVKKALPGVTIDELDESEHVDLVQELGIQSFPTIMVLNSADQNATFYEGPRTKDDIVDFALRNIQPKEI